MVQQPLDTGKMEAMRNKHRNGFIDLKDGIYLCFMTLV